MIKNRYILKSFSWFFIFLMMVTCLPQNGYALTGGPSQPEVQSFSPIGVSDMVDPATGDFSYNIPLLEVGGYPINLTYNAGVTMDQEASIVGLGWNINPGVINRSVVGLPDDFRGDKNDGDEINSEFNIRPNWTFGLNTGFDLELFGAKTKKLLEKLGMQAGVGLSLGMFYNNYNGFGSSFGINPTVSIGTELKDGNSIGLGLGASLGGNSESGNSFNTNASFSHSANSKLYNKRVDKIIADNIGAVSTNQLIDMVSAYKKASGPSASVSISLISTPDFYSPKISYSMKNQSYTSNFKFVGEVFGLTPGTMLSGSFSKQSLKADSKVTPAYGSLFSEFARRHKDAVHDYSREKDVPFSKDVVSLALAKRGQDVYSLSGQGIGGTYNLKRGDLGLLYDNQFKNTSYGGAVGFELGGGNIIRLGGDFHSNYGTTTTSQWSDRHNIFDHIDFQDNQSNDPNYQPAYFKAIGDKSVSYSDESKWEGIAKTSAVSIKLDNEKNVSPKERFSNGQDVYSEIKRIDREKRNESISYLSAAEASSAGLTKKIQNYLMDDDMNPLDESNGITRTEDYRKDHHISEITALRPDGLRYIYGIPAYNITQEDASFNVGNNTKNCTTGTVEYTKDEDDSTDNDKGIDHFYNRTTTPAYAHSYLLTAILSNDYSDLSGDGPTPDDLGSYTKINYSLANPEYNWRLPYQDANHTEGLLSIEADDKGSYMYGEKEYWILHSIESKTQVAHFHYNKKGRRDAHGVIDKHGSRDDGQNMEQLEKIVLYSRPDLVQNGTASIPLKQVHFEYDYSLCKSVPTNDGELSDLGSSVQSNDGGKLTLKKLWFTYGKSIKGKFSPYKFNYSDTNPDYNVKAYNRWSTYGPVNVKAGNNSLVDCNADSDLSVIDFPYIPQYSTDNTDAKDSIDEYVSAWNLDEIDLPSGAKIKVEYEADDYAYVQDKSAMQMFEIVGTSQSIDANGNIQDPFDQWYPQISNDLFLYSGERPCNYIYFKLSESLPADVTEADAKEILREKYLKDISYDGNLYFKVLAQFKDTEEKWEYVAGYYDLNQTNAYGVIPSVTGGDYTHGYIQLKTTCAKDREANGDNCSGSGNNEVNPISKAIWQFIRLNMPKEVHGDSPDIVETDGEDAILSILQGMANMFESVLAFAHGGYNKELRNREFGKHIKKGKSWIRLYNPDKSKLGGTHRVKKISITDNWSAMARGDHESSSYGQEYIYTSQDSDGNQISSGVAAYEPLIGGDEIPLRLPDKYDKENRLAPDDEHYLEQPYGESFYPGPSIIYSKVKTQNIQEPGVVTHGTGYTINEFYTANDFPIKTRKTRVQQKRRKGNPILKLLKVKSKDNLTLSQGYVIELNDMHGKPKATKVYDQWENIVSGVEYEYQTETASNGLGSLPKLDNSVKVINEYGQVLDAYLGLDYDMVADHRESKSKHSGGGVDLNNDNFLIGFIPILTILPYMMWSVDEVMYRSITLTKVIRRSGVLKKTTAFDLGSSVATNNLYYDAETGNPLVTQTFNEFDDPIYNFNYPAHWAYEGMEQAYQNIGMNVALLPGTSTGSYSVSDIEVFEKLTPGDELLIDGSNKGWILTKDQGGQFVFIIDKEGSPIGGSISTCKVIRSGHRNMASASIGSLTSLENPIENSELEIDLQNSIINASAIEYDDSRQIYCKPAAEVNLDDNCECVPNPTIESDFCQLAMDLFSNAIQEVGGEFNEESLIFELNPINSNRIVNNFAFDDNGGNEEICLGQQSQIRCKIINRNNAIALQIYNNIEAEPVCKCEIILWQLPEVIKGSDGNIVNIEFISDPYPYDCREDWAKVFVRIELENNTIEGECILAAGIDYTNGCFNFMKCNKINNPVYCNTNIGQPINPYVQNLKGNYKPNKSYTYLTNRAKSNNPSKDIVNIRKDGTYEDLFDPFWVFNQNTVNPSWNDNPTNWTWTSEITKVNRNGNELESRDPLNRYSAELLGYHDQMVTAVAANARYQQIAYEGFEDIFYNQALQNEDPCINPKHFDLDADTSWIKYPIYPPHTGDYSLQIKRGREIEKSFVLEECDNRNISNKNYDPLFETTQVKCDDCLGTFQPTPGKYIFTAWMTRGLNPESHKALFTYFTLSSDGDVLARLRPKGDFIEGWQRVFGEFIIPSGASELTIKIGNPGIEHIAVDDIRIHPYDASFNSYVYDEHSLRFTYELDENNYFTKYEYDISGNLERVKKETERGVMMIQESRFGQYKGGE